MGRIHIFIGLMLTFALLFCLPFTAQAADKVKQAADKVKQAADQVKLKIEITIDRPETFWDCTFVTVNDMVIGKPAKVVVKYSLGLAGINEKSETVVVKGKEQGKFSLDTARNEVVNFEVIVYDAKNGRLGSTGYQVRNNGQLEFIVIAPPETVLPQFNWGNTIQ